MYVVVLTNPRYTYLSQETAVDGSVRYLSTSGHTCILMPLNTLSVECTLNGKSTPDSSRKDYLTFGDPPKPSAYQIYSGLDSDNLFANAMASGYFPVNFIKLKFLYLSNRKF